MLKRKILNDSKIEDRIYCSFIHHSHIRGIGINNIFCYKNISQGFIAHNHIKKAALIFLNSIKNSELEKLNIVVVGNFGTGKTSLCIAIGLSISKFIPFTAISGAELSSLDISKIETITQSIRKSVGIRFYDESLIIEGEIVDIQINECKQENRAFAKLIIKTNKVQTTYKIGKNMYTEILQKMIKKGDIVVINKDKNIIEKKESFFTTKSLKNYRDENKKIKKGELERYEICEHIATIYELDILNSFSKFPISKLFVGDIKEISNEIREKIDRVLIRWEKNQKIKLIKGILLVDEANILDIECFSFLNKNLESLFSPALILSTNDSKLKTNGVSFLTPHGIPVDFIDRFLVIQVSPHSYNQLENILFLRGNDHFILFNRAAKELLVKIGIECGIRYSVYIMSITVLVFHSNCLKISTMEIKKSFFLFMDSKRFIRCTKKVKKKISI